MGGSNIQAKFEKYQRQYPLYTRSAVVDLMLKDGVITPDIAKKIKSGTSLFLIDNLSFNVNSTQSDFSMTNILGGNFNSSKKVSPKTNFNRKIEPTFQSDKQGDCWLLSDINAMNQTEWGRQAIYDAIIPDKDGSSGVTIKFKGSPLKQKSFHITAKEIQKAKESGYYSKGDDDMIAFELATEKLAKIMVTTKQAQRISSFDDISGYETYISGGGVYNTNGEVLDISELITGVKDVLISSTMSDKTKNNYLKKISSNDKYSSTCTFKSEANGGNTKLPVHSGHAYAIKKMVFNKYVILIDPFKGDKEIKLSYYDFKKNFENIRTSSENNNEYTILNSIISSNEKLQIQESLKISEKINNEGKERDEFKKTKTIFSQVAEILSSFYIDEHDIDYSKLKVPENMDKTIFQSTYIGIKLDNKDKSKNVVNKINKDNVMLLLDIKPDFISILDNYKSGWGKGEEKKALIQPIINALVEKAKEVRIPNQKIKEFNDKCFKELNAFFYTDEKVIIEEVNKIKRLIEQKE